MQQCVSSGYYMRQLISNGSQISSCLRGTWRAYENRLLDSIPVFEFVVCDEAQEFAFLKRSQNMLVYSAHLRTTDLTNLSPYFS